MNRTTLEVMQIEANVRLIEIKGMLSSVAIMHKAIGEKNAEKLEMARKLIRDVQQDIELTVFK